MALITEVSSHNPIKKPQGYELFGWSTNTASAKAINATPDTSPIVPPKNAIDLPYHTVSDTVRLFFKRIPKDQQLNCKRIELEAGYGVSLEDDDKIVILELPEEKLACHVLNTTESSNDKYPIQISWKYDTMVDGLIIYLVDTELCLSLRNNVAVNEQYYDKDLIFCCDAKGLVYAITLINASEYLL